MFRPKADGRVGYIVTLDGVRFYHAGNNDATPEMESLGVDVAFLSVPRTYVMTPEEAPEATKAMKVDVVVVPMHVGSIVGSRADAEKIKNLVRDKPAVEILDKE